MGSNKSKLSTVERQQLEKLTSSKHVVLILAWHPTVDNIFIEFSELIRPFCKLLTILLWRGDQFKSPDNCHVCKHPMLILRESDKIIIAKIRPSNKTDKNMLSDSGEYPFMNQYLKDSNFDLNEHGRLISCYLNDTYLHMENENLPVNSITAARIVTDDEIYSSLIVEIPFNTNFWGGIINPLETIENVIISLETPMTSSWNTLPFITNLLEHSSESIL